MTSQSSFFSVSGATPTTAATISELLASVEDFDTIYLGSFAVAPTLDNSGNALIEGALYFDSVLDRLHVWSGSAWSSYGATVPLSFTVGTVEPVAPAIGDLWVDTN